METLEVLISKLIDSFDFAFMLIINLSTYLIIKTIDNLNGDSIVPTYLKRIIAVAVGIGFTLLALYIGDSTTPAKVLVYSFVLSLVSWDIIFKPLLNYLGDKVNYRKLKD